MAALAAACALALLPAGAQARTTWHALARTMAAPWPNLQEDSGELPDYLDGIPAQGGKGGGTRYGDTFMGYGLIQTGLRAHDRTLIRTGLKAINFATSKARQADWPTPSVFEALAVASAYNLARRRLPQDPLFRKGRAHWAAYMRKLKTVHLQWETHFGNHWLVDALAVLELRRTGVHSKRRGAILGDGRKQATRRATRLINSFIPNWAGSRRSFVLSDPRDYPTAYHGLSFGLYARGVALLGRHASPRARRALRQMVRASALLTAPDGDSAYAGRSQEELWALSGTAYGSELAAKLRGSGRSDDRLAHAVSSRAMTRLATAYPTGSRGTWITPSLAKSLSVGARGVDDYAGAPSMAGIALVQLGWMLDLHVHDAKRGRLPADHSLARTVSEERGRMAVVRRGATWFAVKETRTRDRLHWGDLRYDAGLALALRRIHGRWVELVPERPLTKSHSNRSAGPVLLRGHAGFFHGDSMRVGRSGVAHVGGAYLTGGGRTFRRASFVYRPTRCGVAMSFDARRGESFRLSAFFLHKPRVAGRAAHDGVQRVTVSGGRIKMRLVKGSYASGTQIRLRRVAISVRTPRARRVKLSFCAA